MKPCAMFLRDGTAGGQLADGTAMLMVEIHWRLNNIMIPNKFLAVRDILNTFGSFNFYYRTS